MDIGMLVLQGIGMVLGIAVVWTKAAKILNALKELADVLEVVVDSLQDKSLNKDEVAAIKKEIGEAIDAFRAILK